MGLSAGRLQDHGSLSEAPVVDQEPEPLGPNPAFADVLMPVHPAAQLTLGIVQVKSLHPAQAQHPVQFVKRPAVAVSVPQVVAGGKYVAGVHADAHPLGFLHQRENCRQVFEAVPEMAPLPGGGFQQDQGGYQDEFAQGRSVPSPMAPSNQQQGGGQPQNRPAGNQPPAGGFDNSFDDDIPF